MSAPGSEAPGLKPWCLFLLWAQPNPDQPFSLPMCSNSGATCRSLLPPRCKTHTHTHTPLLPPCLIFCCIPRDVTADRLQTITCWSTQTQNRKPPTNKLRHLGPSLQSLQVKYGEQQISLVAWPGGIACFGMRAFLLGRVVNECYEKSTASMVIGRCVAPLPSLHPTRRAGGRIIKYAASICYFRCMQIQPSSY